MRKPRSALRSVRVTHRILIPTDIRSGSTGKLVDKRLKLEQPSVIHLKPTDTRPIKATKLALDTIRANEIAIENSKTSNVTAVVAVLKIFGDKFAIHRKNC